MNRRFCLLLLSAVLPLYSQIERGNITGQVKDASGSIAELRCTADLDSKTGGPTANRKVRVTQ